MKTTSNVLTTTSAGPEVTEPSARSVPGSPGTTQIRVTRSDVELRPDWSRVVVRPFLPDEQVFPDGGLLDRILSMPEEVVASTLAVAYAQFEDRHFDVEAVLESHFQFVAAEATDLPTLSRDRRLLIGAYYTREFSIEAAALTNPSIVPAPDQSGLESGAQRFVLSLRAIGEGQVSSIELRSGVIDASGGIVVEEPSGY
ncbi:MAG: glycosidase, partial [Acidimicrobiia bacterium]